MYIIAADVADSCETMVVAGESILSGIFNI